MKTYAPLCILVLACSTMFAQTSKCLQSSSQGGSTGMMGSAQTGSGMSGMGQHMQEMQSDLQQMKTQIDQMRTNAQKVQDTNVKTVLLQNADIWDQFISRMQSHMQMMQGGMMQHGMQGHGMKMKKKPSTSSGQSDSTTPK